MAAITDNTYSYYEFSEVTVSNTDYVSWSISSIPSFDYYERNHNPDIWFPPPMAPMIDVMKDRPNKPLVHNRCRHIAPMHFRHVRTQQRRTQQRKV